MSNMHFLFFLSVTCTKLHVLSYTDIRASCEPDLIILIVRRWLFRRRDGHRKVMQTNRERHWRTREHIIGILGSGCRRGKEHRIDQTWWWELTCLLSSTRIRNQVQLPRETLAFLNPTVLLPTTLASPDTSLLLPHGVVLGRLLFRLLFSRSFFFFTVCYTCELWDLWFF